MSICANASMALIFGTGQLNANIMPDGSILTEQAFVPQCDRTLYDGQPSLTAAEALNTAAEQLRWPITSYFVAEQNLGGVEQMQILNTAGVAVDPVPARLIYFLGEDGRLNLAWEAIVQPIHTSDWWQLALDAHTGRVLEQFNWTVSHNPPILR
jgi:extracellular elastinolytic metalloproteinase